MNFFNFLTVPQAAKITGLALSSIAHHIKKGHFQATMLGAQWFIENRHLIEFISNRSQGKYCRSGRPFKKNPVMETFVGSKDLTVELPD